MKVKIALIAIPALLASTGAIQATAADAAQMKAGQRVEVNIAGYRYKGVFKGYVKCNDGTACATIQADDGGKTDTRLKYIQPISGAAPAPPALAQSASGAGSATAGTYTCSFFAGTLQTVPGFTLQAGGKFADHAGGGKFSYDASTGVIAFSGGAWNGQKAKFTGSASAQKFQVLKENGSMGAVTCSRK
jgi:hypothetical protein